MSSLKGWLWVLLGLASPPMALATGISALLDTGGRDWVPRDSEIVIRLSEPPDPGAGGFAVVVGTSDLTDLFRFDGEALTYRPELQPLPAGETEIVVYRVPQGEPWSEIGRFPLRVLRKGGFEQVELRPRIDIESIARLDDGPDETGEETGFEDATAQLGLQGTFARGGWKVDASMNVVGVTDRQKALRFSQDGPEAQKIDLSQYSVDVSRGRGRFSLGHLSYGRGRNLIESFNSRGLSLEVPLGSWGQAGLGVLNGSSIVGWDNFLGIDDRRHQLVAGHLAVEVVPDQPGRLHLLVSALDGSVLPLAGFNQGVVNDSEESRGWALEVASAAFSNRLRFSGGYTESRFDNPSDPLLDPGFDLVPVETETRGARFSDLAFDLFQNRGRKHPTTLTLAWRHREVEPQFRSVGAFAQADRRENTGELMLASGPISFQLSVSGSRDNLDDVASILTTRTRGSSAAFLIPFGQLKAEAPRPWLPTLSVRLDRSHQFGDGVPENSGFNESHVPDQVSLNQSFSLDWQLTKWRLSYVFGFSDQDNRQPGRENADFETRVHTVSLGWMPVAELDLGVDFSRERANNAELQEVAETSRYGINFSWQQATWSTLTGNASRSEALTTPRFGRQDNDLLDLQWTVRLDRTFSERHGFASQLYLRYSYQDSRSEDPTFGFDESFRLWSLTSGINLSLF